MRKVKPPVPCSSETVKAQAKGRAKYAIKEAYTLLGRIKKTRPNTDHCLFKAGAGTGAKLGVLSSLHDWLHAMFHTRTVRDLVTLHPSTQNRSTKEVVGDELDAKYANNVSTATP